jgi:hypothetical protein
MPYQLRLEDGILKLAFFDVVTNQDLVRLLGEVSTLEATRDVMPHRLADLRSVERLDVDFPGIFDLAQARRRLSFPNSFKTAIVATAPVHFGIARMFQTLNDHPQISVSIFGNVEDALKWLADA